MAGDAAEDVRREQASLEGGDAAAKGYDARARLVRKRVTKERAAAESSFLAAYKLPDGAGGVSHTASTLTAASAASAAVSSTTVGSQAALSRGRRPRFSAPAQRGASTPRLPESPRAQSATVSRMGGREDNPIYAAIADAAALLRAKAVVPQRPSAPPPPPQPRLLKGGSVAAIGGRSRVDVGLEVEVPPPDFRLAAALSFGLRSGGDDHTGADALEGQEQQGQGHRTRVGVSPLQMRRNQAHALLRALNAQESNLRASVSSLVPGSKRSPDPSRRGSRNAHAVGVGLGGGLCATPSASTASLRSELKAEFNENSPVALRPVAGVLKPSSKLSTKHEAARRVQKRAATVKRQASERRRLSRRPCLSSRASAHTPAPACPSRLPRPPFGDSRAAHRTRHLTRHLS